MQALPPGGNVEYLWLKPLLAITFVALAVAFCVGPYVRVPSGHILLTYVRVIWTFAPLTCVLVLAGALAQSMVKRVPSPVNFIRDGLRSRLGTMEMATGTLVPIVATPMVFGAFGTIKQVLPLAHSFAWDDRFSAADRLLFLGVQPWRVTHAILSWPPATSVIEDMYRLWLVFLFVGVLGFALAAPRYVRARFFLTFATAWLLLGVGAAILFSSAGPCFAQAIGVSSANEYTELMVRLRQLTADGYLVATLSTQEQLWHSYSTSAYGFGMGISAMPSMHNGIAFLYVLALWNAGRTIRVLTCTFAAFIYVGSIHLGWHYAVDGIMAWAGITLIWLGAGAYLRRCGYESALRAASDVPAPVPVEAGGRLAA